MLMKHADRYLALRRSLGFKLRDAGRLLGHFARFAEARGETRVVAATAVDWAAQGPSPHSRYVRLGTVVRFARFLHTEDPAHEVPRRGLFPDRAPRRTPYIYTEGEIVRLIQATARLRQTHRHDWRRRVFATLIGLIAATGLRISEALRLTLDDLLPDGILRIRQTKFGKSRLVPLHFTVVEALDRYLDVRQRIATRDRHLFLSASRSRIQTSAAQQTFGRLRQLAGIAPDRARRPRIHDLRHTFATRALEKCPTRREAVARHFIALSTYLGHADVKSTYWYLEATPELLVDIVDAAESWMAGRRS